jgi:predicted nucleic acid-binding protein
VIVLDASAAVDLLRTQRAAAVARVLRSLRDVDAPELIDPEAIAVIRRGTPRRWLRVQATSWPSPDSPG